MTPILLWVGCNTLWSVDHLHYRPVSSGEGGAGGGGGGDGGQGLTATTSGEGGGGSSPCGDQLNLGMGETEQCQVCVAKLCCHEYLACNEGDCDPLMACATTANGCAADCFYPICDSGTGYAFGADCAACMGANCCEPTTACVSNEVCMDCLMGDEAACASSALDEAYSDCQTASCAQECLVQS